MIEKTFGMKTKEKAEKLMKIFNSMSGVWGACLNPSDKHYVEVSFYNEEAYRLAHKKWNEVYNED